MSWFFSRTSSSSSVTHKQLFANNTVAQIVATTATESMKRNNCINISTAGCNVVAPMSAHTEAPGHREYFGLVVFFPLIENFDRLKFFSGGPATSRLTEELLLLSGAGGCIPAALLRAVFTGSQPRKPDSDCTKGLQ